MGTARSTSTQADESAVLAEIVAALREPDGAIRLTRLVFGPTRRAVQVVRRGRRIGPLLFPPDGGTLADTLHMLGELVEREDAIEANR